MRTLSVHEITDAVRRLCIESNCRASKDLVQATCDAISREESPIGRSVLEQIRLNQQIAENEEIAMCQDTGVAVVFLEIGQEVHLEGGDLETAVHEGVRRGYKDGFLRKSIVADPLRRTNTGDNTPAVIHVRIVPGDRVRVTLAPKGGGSENMSTVKMLPPSAGREGIIRYVVDWLFHAGANPCPPTVVGVGIGGTFEKVALLAKQALLRPIGAPHPDPFYSEMERDILERVNALGIGPGGFGGRVTAFAVHIETHPCHIASLPLAVNLNCHVSRHQSAEL
ncbi:MAG TPA: fumarate hydratase [Candidatus Sumerlaeota bacterium]|nr:fumarate hydratase [Candidatus Sumerlaeota bacterium]